MAIDTRCPVCNETIQKGVCPQCGYALILFPSEVPEAIHEFEEKRLQVAHDILSQKEKSIRNQEGMKQELCIVKAEHSQSKSENLALAKQLKILENECKEAKATESRLKSDISDLRRTIKGQDSDIAKITNEIEKAQKAEMVAKQKLQIALAHPMLSTANFILNDNGKFSILPINGDGVSFFASGPGMELCPVPESQIILLPIMTRTKIAFSVTKSSSGSYKLTDLAHNVMITGGKNEMRLTNELKINVSGEQFELHFSLQQK